MSLCVCVCACVRACVRACVCVSVSVCVCVYARARASAHSCCMRCILKIIMFIQRTGKRLGPVRDRRFKYPLLLLLSLSKPLTEKIDLAMACLS